MNCTTRLLTGRNENADRMVIDRGRSFGFVEDRLVFLLNLYTSLKMNTANVVVVRAETAKIVVSE